MPSDKRSTTTATPCARCGKPAPVDNRGKAMIAIRPKHAGRFFPCCSGGCVNELDRLGTAGVRHG